MTLSDHIHGPRQPREPVTGVRDPRRPEASVPDGLSFCAEVVETGRALSVADASAHPIYSHNPMVVEGAIGVVKSIRIATIDRLVNDLDSTRKAAGMSKAELARAIGAEPATIRRLFASGHRNPTLGTLAEVASALGMQVTLTALPAADRRQVATPLLAGRSADSRALAEHLTTLRGGKAPPATAS